MVHPGRRPRPDREEDRMNTTRRARWAWGAALGAAGVVLLSACNPISQTPYTPPPPLPGQPATWSTAKLIYDGPADAWIETGVKGISGYQVQTLVAVWVPNPTKPPEPRTCKSATDRALDVTCIASYAEFPHTDLHRADLDATGTYWPAIAVRPGEHFQVNVYCDK